MSASRVIEQVALDSVIRLPVSGKLPAVQFKDVVKRYGSVYAIKRLSFVVEQGEFVTLLGPSGSGKSTILNMIAGVTDPDEGGLFFGEREVTRIAPHKRNIGMVFQRYTLFPNKTVRENIAYPLVVRRIAAAEVKQRVQDMLEMVGLVAEAERYPSEISGGQAQRVAVARALVFDPALMLMDEPLGALDKSLRELLQAEIRRIQHQTKVPTLYVTHDQEEAMNLSDRIVVMNHGEIVANGAPRALYSLPPSLWVAKFLGEANAIKVLTWSPEGEGASVVSTSGMHFRARVHPSISTNSTVCAIVRPEDCNVTRAAPSGRSSLQATVVGMTYLGARQRIDLRTDDGTAMIASAPGRLDLGAEGSTVWVSWEEDCASIVNA